MQKSPPTSTPVSFQLEIFDDERIVKFDKHRFIVRKTIQILLKANRIQRTGYGASQFMIYPKEINNPTS